MSSSATISDCGKYRYTLERDTGLSHGPTMLFVMLNPSTADASEDDPTIRRCIGFAKREGCARIQVVNLYAFRATDAAEMLAEPLREGPDNAYYWKQILARFPEPVFAWGNNAEAHHADKFELLAMSLGCKPICLGKNAGGQPKHPLYLNKETPLVPYYE